jgi:hypothetical protein
MLQRCVLYDCNISHQALDAASAVTHASDMRMRVQIKEPYWPVLHLVTSKCSLYVIASRKPKLIFAGGASMGRRSDFLRLACLSRLPVRNASNDS